MTDVDDLIKMLRDRARFETSVAREGKLMIEAADALQRMKDALEEIGNRDPHYASVDRHEMREIARRALKGEGT